jgi:hypothetical protein
VDVASYLRLKASLDSGKEQPKEENAPSDFHGDLSEISVEGKRETIDYPNTELQCYQRRGQSSEKQNKLAR